MTPIDQPASSTALRPAFPWVALITGLSAVLIVASELFVIAVGIDYAVSGLLDLPRTATIAIGLALMVPALWLTWKFGLAVYRVDRALSRGESVD